MNDLPTIDPSPGARVQVRVDATGRRGLARMTALDEILWSRDLS